MFRLFKSKRTVRHCAPRPKAHAFEQLKDRRLLAPMADVLFLFDESQSGEAQPGQPGPTQQWLASIADELDASLRSTRKIDVRYGLVGFGDVDEFTNTRYAHSQIAD